MAGFWGLENTYKGLKPRERAVPFEETESLENTYKGLKRAIELTGLEVSGSLENTYKGLKLVTLSCMIFPTVSFGEYL